ncbi:hypothetical protein AUW17_07930 [Tenacibaculum dicentrarchi]|nr:hypothetical protein AUW17_07930 [Tenacibaculum dicentrarchi]
MFVVFSFSNFGLVKLASRANPINVNPKYLIISYLSILRCKGTLIVIIPKFIFKKVFWLLFFSYFVGD